MKDYYEVLVISRNASKEEIEAAYNHQMNKYKSESQPNVGVTSLIIEEIEEAYLTLSDPIKKRVYDSKLIEYDAEQVYKKRQLANQSKKKPLIKDPYNWNKETYNWTRIWVVAGIALVLIVGTVGFLFFDFGRFFREKDYLSETYEVYKPANKSTTSISENNEGNEGAIEKPENPVEKKETNEDKINVNPTPKASENIEPKVTEVKPNNPPAAKRAPVAKPKLNSIEDYFKALGNQNYSYQEKSALMEEALTFFKDKNTNVIVYGKNEVQTGREAIADYLAIVMIQNYKVSILNLEKNNEGKITQISVLESI